MIKTHLVSLYDRILAALGPRKPLWVSLLAIFILLLLYAGWHHLQTHVSTDNGYVNADSIQIASQVTGPVLKLYILNNQLVQKGDPLFDIDPETFELAIDEANAAVLQTKAQLQNASINLGRTEKLVAQKFLPPEERDNAVTAVDVASANLKMAEAKLKEAKVNLKYTRVTAPTTGIINNLSLPPGSVVQAEMPLFVLISTQKFWVDSNYKETELTNIRPNQTAKIVLDMYPDKTFNGMVESISGGSGTVYSLLPPQNATGNWVKVTQRIPVKVIITDPDPNYPLRVGATATVTIHTPKSSYQPK